MVRLTSRAMEKPWFGCWYLAPIPQLVPVKLLYIDQDIPSPVGMGFYEQLLAPTVAYSTLKAVLLNPATPELTSTRAHEFDSTGNRVWGYMKMISIACNLRLLHQHLSIGRPYAFQPDDYASSPSLGTIAQLLGHCCG